VSKITPNIQKIVATCSKANLIQVGWLTIGSHLSSDRNLIVQPVVTLWMTYIALWWKITYSNK